MRALTLVRIGVLLAAVAGIGYYLQRITTTTARYSEYPNQFHYIFNQEGTVDVATMGGSRTMRAVDAPYLSSVLEPQFKRKVVVYDMSRSGRGMDANFVILRDLVENRPVRLLLVEYNDTLPGSEVHPNFFRLASWRDLGAEVSTYPNLLLGFERAGQHAGAKIGDHLANLWRPYKAVRKAISPAVTSDYSFPTTVTPSRLLTRTPLKDSWRDQPARDWDLDSELEMYQTILVERLVEMARAHGAKIAFFHLPGLYYPVFSDAFVKKFQERFGAPLWQPSPEELERMYADGYADPSHFREKGSHLYMDWLGLKIVSEVRDVH